MKLRPILAAVASITMVVVSAYAGQGQHHNGSNRHNDRDRHKHEQRQHNHYTVALFGDMPYGALGKQQYPNMIADVNAAKVAFSVFDGDLKSGGDGPCTDDNLYLPALANFAMFVRPLIFLPGDNDWTDCRGLYGPSTTTPETSDPIERLQHERDLFFSTPYSLGQEKLRLTGKRSTSRTSGGSTARSSSSV